MILMVNSDSDTYIDAVIVMVIVMAIKNKNTKHNAWSNKHPFSNSQS